jgi:hypothetical protein
MPLSIEQQRWLEERELDRVKKSEGLAKQMFETYQAKSDKKKDTDKEKNSKNGKLKDPQTLSNENITVHKRKYTSVEQFMSIHFPDFESKEAMAPMRQMQLLEIAEIMQSCENYDTSIKESVLRKALLVPQDKADAICLEGLRDEKEGLMLNPNPSDCWRKMVMKTGKKGGKKKKKSG